MASGWVKSLQCKSRAFEDVYHPNPKLLKPSSSCRQSVQNIKDMVDIPKPRKPKPKLQKHSTATTKPDVESSLNPTPTINRSRSSNYCNTNNNSSRSITELPEGHPSRNVVEIIFHTSWGPKKFPGRVEMIFKVQNGSRTMSRFEEFRDAVKGRARAAEVNPNIAESNNWEEENARCVADGNEVMQFHCLQGAVEDGGAHCALSFKGSAICTFSGSGDAHENAGTGGDGRRAMFVCRVVAGRVSKRVGFLEKRCGFDSVSGEKNGELIVFDPRAVLPCFLIVYRL